MDGFDGAVGGLRGCPYAGLTGAAANIATEDLVHLCGEIGLETGGDLSLLLDVAREAEAIGGHTLPGKVMRGGALSLRRQQPAAPDSPRRAWNLPYSSRMFLESMIFLNIA